jgi:uncharacterized membrane protein
VEAVEALTIALAMGVTRGWRAALAGTAAASVVLAVIVAALGPALTVIPIEVLRARRRLPAARVRAAVVRKAILRASGWRALRDESSVYEREAAAGAQRARARSGRGSTGTGSPSPSRASCSKASRSRHRPDLRQHAGSIPLAAAGAAAAAILVIIAGVVVRGPLSRVPENTLAFAVGVMLTTFGIFWAAEGAGVDWPGDDAALPFVLAFVVLVSLGYVTALRRRKVAVA